MKPIALYLATLAAMTPAQTAPERIEVAITRTATVGAEEAMLFVLFTAPSMLPLDCLFRAVAPGGLRPSDLQTVFPFYGSNPPGLLSVARLNYIFAPRAPIAQISAAFERFDQLRRSLLAGDTGVELVTQSINGFGASEKALSAARAQLLADALPLARERGEAIARAAGLLLGPIVRVIELPDPYAPGIGSPTGMIAGLSISVHFAVSR